jgi:hypothetical protein
MLIFIFIALVTATFDARGADKYFRPLHGTAFTCHNYRDCILGYYAAFTNNPIVYYLEVMSMGPDCFITEVRYEDNYQSFGADVEGNLLPDTYYPSTSFTRIFNTQCINLVTHPNMTRFFIFPTIRDSNKKLIF